MKEEVIDLTLTDQQKEEEHNKNCKKILMNPKIIGLDNIILSGQINLFIKGQLIAQPDGLFFDGSGRPYLMEYKLSKHGRNRACEQLDNAKAYLRCMMTWKPKKLYVYGSLCKKEVIL